MSEPGYLIDVLIILGAAVLIVPLFQRLKASMVLGFLVAGAMIGPFGFDLLREIDAPQHVADADQVKSIVGQYRADDYAPMGEIIFPTTVTAPDKRAVATQPAE